MTLRALVSTKDAGVIIGKAGKNVADLREQTGVKAGVSKVIPGVHERVLTVTGPVEGVAKVHIIVSYLSIVYLWSFLGLHPDHLSTCRIGTVVTNHVFAIRFSYLYPTFNFA